MRPAAQKSRPWYARTTLPLPVILLVGVVLALAARPLREWKDRADGVTYAGASQDWRRAYRILAEQVRRDPRRGTLGVRTGGFWFRSPLDDRSLYLRYDRGAGRLQGRTEMGCTGMWEGVTDAALLRAVERLDAVEGPHAMTFDGARSRCP